MKDVSLFIPCIVDLLLPEVGEATVTVLRKLGLNPIYHSNQTCCGEPAINSGYQKHAVKAAKHFIEVFEEDEASINERSVSVTKLLEDHLVDAKIIAQAAKLFEFDEEPTRDVEEPTREVEVEVEPDDDEIAKAAALVAERMVAATIGTPRI